MRKVRISSIVLSLLVLLGIIGAAGFWQRTQIAAWYAVSRLSMASAEERDSWAAQVVELDDAALPWLLARLACDDALVCGNSEAALLRFAHRWPIADPRCEQVVEQLRARFPMLSVPGKQAALRFPVELFRRTDQPLPATVTLSAGKLLAVAVGDPAIDPTNALVLAEQLSDRVPHGQWHDTCRQAAVRGLQDARPGNRILAVHLALQAVFAADAPLLGSIAPLLRDTDARVRRAALVAVGMSRDAAAEEELLPLLHDVDHEVRRLCETALRSRGLRDEQLLLARLISDQRPNARLDVFNYLYGADSVEPGVWLRRLSQDASPAVRGAAIRTAFTQGRLELCERIRQMARDDPSPTVRQLAAHYLTRFSRAGLRELPVH